MTEVRKVGGDDDIQCSKHFTACRTSWASYDAFAASDQYSRMPKVTAVRKRNCVNMTCILDLACFDRITVV